MISALVVSLLAAEHLALCNQDLDCFVLAAKTCQRASYSDANLDKLKLGQRQDETAKGETQYVITGAKDGKCEVTVQTRIDGFELGVLLTTQLGRAASTRRGVGLQTAKDLGVLQRCVMSPEQLKSAVERQRRGEPVEWAGCTRVGCAAVLASDNGCAWSECLDAKQSLKCGEQTCAASEAVLIREHQRDERPCLATCAAGRPEATASCR